MGAQITSLLLIQTLCGQMALLLMKLWTESFGLMRKETLLRVLTSMEMTGDLSLVMFITHLALLFLRIMCTGQTGMISGCSLAISSQDGTSKCFWKLHTE